MAIAVSYGGGGGEAVQEVSNMGKETFVHLPRSKPLQRGVPAATK